MDLHWGNGDESEALCIEDDDCNIDSIFEEERCGICIDIVIDRGMLDCCDHWFCFACIDNWASITNLCPICKNEFQHITCIPVYDTIKSIRFEEHPISRDDDWSFQGKNNTLSFPSYYISEDAVRCLENEGCKLQRAMQATEDDLSFDTSIACDSCDIWYHAFCVGFNPEFTSENSWLCPRCIDKEMLQNSNADSLKNFLKHSTPQTAEIGWAMDSCLSGKVSVAVADAGETAVVVSMIEGKQNTEWSPLFDSLDADMDILMAKSSLYSDIESSKTNLQLEDESTIQVSQNSLIFSDYEECHANVSEIDNRSEIIFDISPEIVDFSSFCDLKDATISPSQHDAVSKPQLTPPLQDAPFSLYFSEANDKDRASALEGNDSLCSDIYTSEVCGIHEANDELENKSASITDTYFTALSHLAADNTLTSFKGDIVVDFGKENKEDDNMTAEPEMSSACVINTDENDECIRKRESDAVYPVKKLKLDTKVKTLSKTNQSVLPFLDGSQVCTIKNRDASLRNDKQEEAEAPDIMSIVQEGDCISHDMPTEMKDGDKLTSKKDSICGPRIKKIMRRVGEKKESSIIAQELGKEIRKVAQQKVIKGIGKNDFDEKLLAAFRAATAKPKTNSTKRSELFEVGAKKHLLIKGKKRENLAKKIYATAGGRRRHAWARDLEIEFWKHRCRRTQPDKVDTLLSVLELLKKATNPQWNNIMELDPQEESKDSILSRVYVADASLFPRKDDIKPLAALSGSAELDKHILDNGKVSKNAAKGPLNEDKHFINTSNQDFKISLQLKDNSFKANSINISSSKSISCKATADLVQSSESNSFKATIETSKEHSCPSDSKTDKRKWALEVLARKTASANINANKGHEDVALLKGKYPLLEQLPQDMRPVLEFSRHDKVSASVRQAQLYRITEHYLRRANIPAIRRTAETELAVADALNVEREIFGRSNSKLVYANLCAQVVTQLANKPESAETKVPNSFNDTLIADKVITKGSKSNTGTDAMLESTESTDSAISNEGLGELNVVGWSNVEEALKMAGLFSDTPPGSPNCAVKDSIEEDKSFQVIVSESLDCALQPMDTKQDASMTRSSEKTVMPNDCVQKESGTKNLITDLRIENIFPTDMPVDTEQDASMTQSSEKSVMANDCIQKESGTENLITDHSMENIIPTDIPKRIISNDSSLEVCEGVDKKSLIARTFDKDAEVLKKPLFTEEDNHDSRALASDTRSCISDPDDGGSAHIEETLAGKENIETQSIDNAIICDDILNGEHSKLDNGKSDISISISKKVEAYIKEHIRPLCKSRVITVDQYRWAVGKTLDKVMKFHHKEKNANFLIREGKKVKKLAEQYVETSQQKELK